MTEKERTIALYQTKLGLSYADAEQLWKDEQEDNLPELTADQKKVEKEMRQADRKVETAKRVRERKPDIDKRFLMDALAYALVAEEVLEGDPVCATDVRITNIERELEFTYNGNMYRLTLSKPRKEKK